MNTLIEWTVVTIVSVFEIALIIAFVAALLIWTDYLAAIIK
jgi:hypothetical protein